MSADNGTYILQTYGPEYRVIHCQAIDNIYGTYCEETHTYLPNVKALVDTFGQAKKFDDLEEAWDFALALERQIEYSEYGACLVKEFEAYSFSDLKEKSDGAPSLA